MATYDKIYKHYESTLKKYGPTSKGMDWPNEKDAEKRFLVMMRLIDFKSKDKIKLLDLGCGVGLLVDYLKANKLYDKIEYVGMDISANMISEAKKRCVDDRFECRDIIKNPIPKDSYDYIIMNGVMTEKLSLSQHEMISFAEKIIKTAYESCKKGITFNVMSSHVDTKREDLFHYPLDQLVGFLVKECSRHIKINMDYGLYEYTTYVYRQPQLR